MILSVSIVIYKPQESILRPCLEKLSVALHAVVSRLQQTVSLTVVDNSPASFVNKWLSSCLDALFNEDARVLLHQVHLPHNPGYGAANNKALLNSQATYHLVLNPDVYMPEDTLVQLIFFMEAHLDVGLCAPAVFGLHGERQYLCKRSPTLFDAFLRSCAPTFVKSLFKQRMAFYECRDLDYEKMMWDVPFMTGCFMFFRCRQVQAIHGFDERFFMYYDDADISRRLLAVARTAYIPSVQVQHRWARDTYNSWYMRFVTIFSAFKYYVKWRGLFIRKKQRIVNE